ncbi:signal peptidase I [Candidatus Enterococcus clewellii]|uniref:Signal peptidase I n=1 Tax=Candidatus Enterococcus clewellii TaxID=1834193 RepID=A0A242JVG2_9ENTE|nr:signal peptidase I [Enterococcus sp. 9E7_DIV0242]OTP06779.1 hypothetical protein A5888_004183 [Enterococcus sp. 9E7_DIV0242]
MKKPKKRKQRIAPSSPTRRTSATTSKKADSASLSRKKKRTIQKKNSDRHPQKKTRPTARQRKKEPEKAIKRILLQLGLSIFLTIGLVYLISLFTFTIQRMEGYMMAPTVTDREVLFVNKLGTVRRFDLVLIEDEQGIRSVRRVVGLPTESISYKNDELFINGTYQVERFLEKKLYETHQMGMILTKDFTISQVTGEAMIPKEEYFVLGDNRAYAQDSRDYGTVKKTQIVGIVKARLFPFHKLSGF